MTFEAVQIPAQDVAGKSILMPRSAQIVHNEKFLGQMMAEVEVIVGDVRSWKAVEYVRSSPKIRIVRAEELRAQVQCGEERFEVGINALRPLAEALNRVHAEIFLEDVD